MLKMARRAIFLDLSHAKMLSGRVDHDDLHLRGHVLVLRIPVEEGSARLSGLE